MALSRCPCCGAVDELETLDRQEAWEKVVDATEAYERYRTRMMAGKEIPSTFYKLEDAVCEAVRNLRAVEGRG